MSDHNHTADAAHIDTHHDDSHAEALAETSTLFGRTFPYPLYTVIFGALAILTAGEIIIAEIFTSWFKIVVLMGIAIFKAALVVIYYMHLKSDSKLFALALLVPTFIATLSLMFLLLVPYGTAY